VELSLESIVHGGRCLARLTDGRVALVAGGIPGETVEADLHERSGVLQGEVTRVKVPSPDRVPASEHPGLDYSHIAYERQLALKREVVADALRRAAKGAGPEPAATVPAPSPWHYRHAVQTAVTPKGPGYRRPGSHEVVVLESDPVAHESINEGFGLWRRREPPKPVHEIAWRANGEGRLVLCLISRHSARVFEEFAQGLVSFGIVGVSHAPFHPRGRFRGGVKKLAGKRFLLQRYGSVTVSVSATGFSQPNPEAASLLFAELLDLAGLGEHAVDLYAGGGVIAMQLSPRFREITAIELDMESVKRGIQDARRLGIDNVTFLRGDVRALDGLPEADLVTVDPPRAGLAKSVREAIIASKTRRLLYVSCDAASWARDAAELLHAGFRLELARPYDFYPQTHHVEILSLFTRG
jgi:23S rRNA (uracil1939-C5)-methyltransferase